MKKKTIALYIPFIIWLLMFIVIPVILILYYGFTSQDGSITLENFKQLADPTYLVVMVRSMWLAFLATVICLLIGYPIAMILAGNMFKRKTVLLVLFIAPMWMNFLLRTYAWLTLLENSGLINQMLEYLGVGKVQFLYRQSAVVLGMVYNLLPYMIFPIYTSISKIPKNMLEAAADLGAGSFRRLVKIIFPMSIPGIVSGITMVFVPGVTTFVVSKLLGGGKVPMIGDIIEQQFGVLSNWHFGSAISIAVMIIIVICMWFVNRTSDEEGGTALW